MAIVKVDEWKKLYFEEVFDHLREAGPVICEMEWTPGLEYLRKVKFILFTCIRF
jgi:hypothetical protein